MPLILQVFFVELVVFFSQLNHGSGKCVLGPGARQLYSCPFSRFSAPLGSGRPFFGGFMRFRAFSLFSAGVLALAAQMTQAQTETPQRGAGAPRAAGSAQSASQNADLNAPQADTSRGITASGSGKVYKSVDAQGRVTYSSVPQANSKAIDPTPLSSGITPFRAPSAQALQQQTARAGTGAPMPDSVAASPSAAPANRWAAISQAQDNLKAAQAAQAQGVAPLGGERLATGNGGTRFSPLYDERQAQLAGAVQKAQKDLEDAEKMQ